ncbi:MAG: polysulfide reductase NrfD [Clostridia bacterium]|nr:polysulfide reductase NrfD [Clostridia bacterium]
MKRLYYLCLLTLTLLGFWALGVRLLEGLKVTGLTSYFSWGAWVVLYIFFIGLSAGSFLLSTMIYVFNMHSLEKVGRIALLSALFALIGGLLFVFIDLGHPERFWRSLVYWNTASVLVWEIRFYLLYILLVLAELWLVMREDLGELAKHGTGWRRPLARVLSLGYRPAVTSEGRNRQQAAAARWVKILGILGVPMAVGVHGGTGSLFAVTIAKPFWNNSIVPVVFIVSALVSGAALVTFLYAFFAGEEEDKLGVLKSLAQLLILFIGIDLLLVAAEYLVGLYSGIPDDVEPMHQVIAGQYGLIFWLGQIGLAAVVPLLLCSLPRTRNSSRWLGLAGLSAIIGIVAVRVNLILPAYTVPQLSGLEKAYVDSRLTYNYLPSGNELLTSIGLIAFLVLLFSLTWEALPLVKGNSMRQDNFEGRIQHEGSQSQLHQA